MGGKRFSVLGIALIALAIGLWARDRGAAAPDSVACADACCSSAACSCCDEDPLERTGCGELLVCGTPGGGDLPANPATSTTHELCVTLRERRAASPADERPGEPATQTSSRWSSRRPAPEPMPPRPRDAQA